MLYANTLHNADAPPNINLNAVSYANIASPMTELLYSTDKKRITQKNSLRTWEKMRAFAVSSVRCMFRSVLRSTFHLDSITSKLSGWLPCPLGPAASVPCIGYTHIHSTCGVNAVKSAGHRILFLMMVLAF